MWIFTSLSRADKIQRVVDSYEWGDHTTILLTLLESDPKLDDYLVQPWPASWKVEIVPMPGNGPTYNEVLRRYPNEPCYGFLADDAVLTTAGMLRALEIEAGRDCVSYANDQHHGEKIPTLPCIGGDLVRRVGYLAPRNLPHWGIDCCWHAIGERLGKLRYRPDLVYDHMHPLWGTGEWDATYRSSQKASIFYEQIYRSWLVNELPRLMERMEDALVA